MSKKLKIVLATYVSAAIVVLGLCTWVEHNSLADYRLAAKYSSGRAFEETVGAVDGLSRALEKSVYATDGGMCSRICSEAYANALAAETAMSTLPFSTQELEQIAAFLNVAGDYAYTLSRQTSQDGFTEEQVETLTGMSSTAAALAESLRSLQGSVNGGDVTMDSREARLMNVGLDDGTEKLSARLLQYEAEFQPMAEFIYDGRFSPQEEEESLGRLDEQEMLAMAAEFAGVEQEELKKEYDYQGEDGRSCYSARGMTICVSPAGVESMSQSRLVGESALSQEEAERIAGDFLEEKGYEELELDRSSINGAVASMRFVRLENGAVCLDDTLSISVALDDGSIYSFNAVDYSGEETGAEWAVSREEAETAIPGSLSVSDMRKVILKSPGGQNLSCYEFSCTDGEQRQVVIYVDAATGKQCEIVTDGKRV